MTATLKSNNKLQIPTKTLPDDWRELGAKEFGVSEGTIEKVVYGGRKNPQIFAFMLKMAEEKAKADQLLEDSFKARLDALNQQI